MCFTAWDQRVRIHHRVPQGIRGNYRYKHNALSFSSWSILWHSLPKWPKKKKMVPPCDSRIRLRSRAQGLETTESSSTAMGSSVDHSTGAFQRGQSKASRVVPLWCFPWVPAGDQRGWGEQKCPWGWYTLGGLSTWCSKGSSLTAEAMWHEHRRERLKKCKVVQNSLSSITWVRN